MMHIVHLRNCHALAPSRLPPLPLRRVSPSLRPIPRACLPASQRPDLLEAYPGSRNFSRLVLLVEQVLLLLLLVQAARYAAAPRPFAGARDCLQWLGACSGSLFSPGKGPLAPAEIGCAVRRVAVRSHLAGHSACEDGSSRRLHRKWRQSHTGAKFGAAAEVAAEVRE